MSVEAQQPEYRKYLKVWQRIEAAVEGTRAIKSGKTMFLPKPNQDLDGESFYGTPIQSENDVRYKQYLERAVYTNFCGRTLAGLKGAAFRKSKDALVDGKAGRNKLGSISKGCCCGSVKEGQVSAVGRLPVS